jgi:hypothetical protein
VHNHPALIDFRLPVTCFRERARDRLKFRELRITVRRAKVFEDSFGDLQVSDERLGETIHVEYDADSGIDAACGRRGCLTKLKASW